MESIPRCLDYRGDMRLHKPPTTTNPQWAPGCSLGRVCPSGDNVGQQLALDLGDLVFEQQLSLFQPLQFELVDGSARGESRDHLVEVAVFSLPRGEVCFQSFDVEITGRAGWREPHSRNP